MNHILAPIAIAVPAAVLLFGFRRSWSPKAPIYALFGLACIIATNLFWLLPLFRLSSYYSLAPSMVGGQLEGPSFFTVYLKDADYYKFSLLLLALAGLGVLKEKRRGLFFSLGLGGVWLLCLAFLSGGVKTSFLIQRYRYILALDIVAVLLAAVYLTSWEWSFVGPRLSRRLGSSVGAGLLLCGVFSLNYAECLMVMHNLYYRPRTFEEATPFPTTLMPRDERQFLSWIKERTSSSGRILLEDSDRFTYHAYWRGHLPWVLPILVKREIMGGPYPYYFSPFHYAGFYEGVLAGRPISQIGEEEFKSYCELYNVGWIVVFTPQAKECLSRLSKDYLSHEGDIGEFSLYLVKRRFNFFLRGEGGVVADYNRLFLRDVRPEEGRVVLKYHYLETLKTRPDCQIRSRKVGHDPVGFIEIFNPPRQLEIYN